MFCRNCGSKLDDDWNVCPKCGTKVSVVNKEIKETVKDADNKKMKHKKEKVKKPFYKKIWFWIIGVLAVFLFIPSGSENDNGEKVLQLVQNSYYETYKNASYKDVLEYCWNGGKWETFVADDENNTRIVEYSVPGNNKTSVQFAVASENNSVEMVFIQRDGVKAADKFEGESWMNSMYLSYFEYKYPMNELDIHSYINKNIKKLLNDSNAFVLNEEEFGIYEDVSGSVMIFVSEDIIYSVSITGTADYSPSFNGVRIGDELQRIDVSFFTELGYTKEVVRETDGCVFYCNPSNEEGVVFGVDMFGRIISITWAAGVLELESSTGTANDDVKVSGEFWRDVENGYLFAHANGTIIDENGISISEYGNYTVLSNGKICKGNEVLEGYTVDRDGRIFYEEPEIFYEFFVSEGRYYDFSNGSENIVYSVEIYNVTDTTFDFCIYENDTIIFKRHTAEITSSCTGTYYGNQYTLDFSWRDPGTVSVRGFDVVEGLEFINNAYYGVS